MQNVTLFGNRVTAEAMKMRSHWSRVGLSFNRTYVLGRRWPCEERHTENHLMTEDWRAASTSRGTLVTAGKPGEAGKRKEGRPCRLQTEQGPADTL